MQTSICLALAIAVAVTAIPTYDDAVPETALEQYIENTDADYATARKSVQSLMQTGKSDKECRDLAKASKKAIEDDVKADQKILDAVPTGDSCKNEGASLKSSSLASLNKAKQDEADATKKLNAAKAANVDFGSIPYNQLTPGQCGTFFNHQGYKTAKAALDKAHSNYSKAKGALTASQKAYDDAVAAADSGKARCLCKAKKAHDKAWDQVKATKHKSTLDWKTAHNVECVLDGTPVSKCKVPPEPQVKAPKLNAEAAKMSTKCNDGSLGALVAYNTKCGYVRGQKLQYLDRVPVKCAANQALSSFQLRTGGCGGNNMQYSFTCGAVKLGATRSVKSGCSLAAGKTDQYLDRQFPSCQSDEVMTSFKLSPGGCGGNNMRYIFDCAKLTLGHKLKFGAKPEYTNCSPIKNKKDEWLDRQNVKCSVGSAINSFRLVLSGCSGSEGRYEHWCSAPQ